MDEIQNSAKSVPKYLTMMTFPDSQISLPWLIYLLPFYLAHAHVFI